MNISLVTDHWTGVCTDKAGKSDMCVEFHTYFIFTQEDSREIHLLFLIRKLKDLQLKD